MTLDKWFLIILMAIAAIVFIYKHHGGGSAGVISVFLLIFITSVMLCTIFFIFPNIQEKSVMKNFYSLNDTFIEKGIVNDKNFKIIKKDESGESILLKDMTYIQCDIIKKNIHKVNEKYNITEILFNKNNTCEKNVNNTLTYNLTNK